MNKLRLIIVAVLLPLLASAQTGKKDFVKVPTWASLRVRNGMECSFTTATVQCANVWNC